MKKVNIGEYTLEIPLIQGGMGVGVSLGNLAGHVAKCGGMGMISTAQIGFKEPDFQTNVKQANQRAIFKEIKKAKEIASGHGMVGVNIMVALRDYKEHVKAAIQAGADCIISGAGLPLGLPGLIGQAKTMIAPIVSSGKACRLILRSWDRKFQKTADFIVIEGVKAGGHLGFKKEDVLSHHAQPLLEILADVKKEIMAYQIKYQKHIPIFVAGGIFTHEEIINAIQAGADGVQMGTRFIGTKECDASEAYKEAFVNCCQDDIVIVDSPVGLPGRAMNNAFVKKGHHPIKRCFACISSCHMTNAPYCITEALINAVNGDLDHGLIFTGVNGYRINKIVSVKELISELMGE